PSSLSPVRPRLRRASPCLHCPPQRAVGVKIPLFVDIAARRLSIQLAQPLHQLAPQALDGADICARTLLVQERHLAAAEVARRTLPDLGEDGAQACLQLVDIDAEEEQALLDVLDGVAL